jgi:hypothetical protein
MLTLAPDREILASFHRQFSTFFTKKSAKKQAGANRRSFQQGFRPPLWSRPQWRVNSGGGPGFTAYALSPIWGHSGPENSNQCLLPARRTSPDTQRTRPGQASNGHGHCGHCARRGGAEKLIARCWLTWRRDRRRKPQPNLNSGKIPVGGSP